jgi:cAMP-dependent protein kinase regulator
MIVDSMDIAQVKSREFIIRQGEEGDFFYIVYSGELSILVDGKHVGTIGVGAGFGELALLHNTPRAASIKAETNVSLFSLDRKTFRYIIAQRYSLTHLTTCSLTHSLKVSVIVLMTSLHR